MGSACRVRWQELAPLNSDFRLSRSCPSRYGTRLPPAYAPPRLHFPFPCESARDRGRNYRQPLARESGLVNDRKWPVHNYHAFDRKPISARRPVTTHGRQSGPRSCRIAMLIRIKRKSRRNQWPISRGQIAFSLVPNSRLGLGSRAAVPLSRCWPREPKGHG